MNDLKALEPQERQTLIQAFERFRLMKKHNILKVKSKLIRRMYNELNLKL